jgi:signal transduction histidine kinase
MPEGGAAPQRAEPCSHRGPGKLCPISKTPCMGECVYADILADINLGIIGLDTARTEVFYQNKLAVELFKGTIRPKDYRAIAALLLADAGESIAAADATTSRRLRYGNRFLGFTIYRISETLLWIYVSDITEKTRLGAIAEAVNTMNNLGYIFSGIRHELGNPVNSIKTTATVLKQNIDGYTKETVVQYVDRILADLNRVEVLLRDLKNFSMYENPEVTDVDLPAFVENLVAMSRRDFARAQIRIKTLLRPEADRVRADPRALQQVMLNVMTNAADALKGRPEPLIVISTRRLDDRIVIKIHDNGCGIPADQRKYLFIPFSTTKAKGTGLGLVIIQKMLAKMGGTVEIESTEGEETTVALNLPLGDATGA